MFSKAAQRQCSTTARHAAPLVPAPCHLAVNAFKQRTCQAGTAQICAPRSSHLARDASSRAGPSAAVTSQEQPAAAPPAAEPAVAEAAAAPADALEAAEPSELPEAEAAAQSGDEVVAEEVEAVREAMAPTTSETDEYYEVQVMTPQAYVDRAGRFLTTTNAGRGMVAGVVILIGASLGVAVSRVLERVNSSRNLRLRQLDKNKAVVTELSNFLPNNRDRLSGGAITALRLKTGFTPVEIYRKFLWFLLRERPFDTDAVQDLVALKRAAGLSDTEVAEAIRERAQRVYEKYGGLVLDTHGMTSSGVERKATCQALFKKLHYLTTEVEDLIPQGGEAAASVDLRNIFGATEDDVAALRIVSLQEVDLEKLDRMVSGKADE